MRTLALSLTFAVAITACNSNAGGGRSLDATSDVATSDADGGTAVDGADGADGSDGTSAVDGTDGSSVVDGNDGATAADGTDGSSATDGVDGTDGSTGVNSPLVDPSCIDGQWSETLPAANADISGPIANYSAAKADDFVLQVLSARYPVGQWLVEGGLDNADVFGGQSCIDAFLSNKTQASNVIDSLSTVVHECGHFYDIGVGGFGEAGYQITPERTFKCQGGSYTGPNSTFARSLMNLDEYSAQRPPCESFGSNDPSCDFYAIVYLDGDPNNSTFEGGDQGFDSVLEETVQYVNSLATGYAFADQYAFSVSERDGILTFLWYVTRYLRLARTQYTASYDVIINDECWREAILTTWGRAWLYLEATRDNSNLGLNDEAIEQLLTPELLEEIQRIRNAQGC